MKSYYNIKTKQEVVILDVNGNGVVYILPIEDWKIAKDLEKDLDASAHAITFILPKLQTYSKIEFKQLFVEKTLLTKALYGYQ